jgi:hypothetical protein
MPGVDDVDLEEVLMAKFWFTLFFFGLSTAALGADSDPVNQVLVPMQSVFSTQASMDLGEVSFIGQVADPSARNKLMEKIFVVDQVQGQFELVDENRYQSVLSSGVSVCAIMFLDADRMLSDLQFQQIGIPRPTALDPGTQFKMDRAPDVSTLFVKAQSTFQSGFFEMQPFRVNRDSVVLTLNLRLFDGVAAPRMTCVIPSQTDRMPSLGELNQLLGDSLGITL